jgi:hypothetical protein
MAASGEWFLLLYSNTHISILFKETLLVIVVVPVDMWISATIVQIIALWCRNLAHPCSKTLHSALGYWSGERLPRRSAAEYVAKLPESIPRPRLFLHQNLEKTFYFSPVASTYPQSPSRLSTGLPMLE